METKKQGERVAARDNYYSIIEPHKIPDMLAVYGEEMDDLKMTITGLRENNLYILNSNHGGGSRNKKFLFEKFSRIPTIPYPRCNLSGNDCIKKSILYNDKKRFDKLPVIHSASSSDVECPADDESGCSEKTYSVCESDTYTVSDDERSHKVLERYPDSFDSDSSYLVSDDDSSNDSKRIDKGVVDVVEKVINNYHNLLRNFYDPVKTKKSKKKSDDSEKQDSLTEIILEPPDMFSDTASPTSAESSFEYLAQERVRHTSLDSEACLISSSTQSNIESFEEEKPFQCQFEDTIFKSETAMQLIRSLSQSPESYGCRDGISDGSTIEADDLESFYSESDPLNSTLTEHDFSRFTTESEVSTEFKIPQVFISPVDEVNLDFKKCHDDSIDRDEPQINDSNEEVMFVDAENQDLNSNSTNTSTVIQTDPLSDSIICSDSTLFSEKNDEKCSQQDCPLVVKNDYLESPPLVKENAEKYSPKQSYDGCSKFAPLLEENEEKYFPPLNCLSEMKNDCSEATPLVEEMEEKYSQQECDLVAKIGDLNLGENFENTSAPLSPKKEIKINDHDAISTENTDQTGIDEVDNFQNIGRNEIDSLLFDSWQPMFPSKSFARISTSSSEDDQMSVSSEELKSDDDQCHSLKDENSINEKATPTDEKCLTNFISDDNYICASNLYENMLVLKDAKCSICLEENPVYEIIQELFKQWESKCVEILLLDRTKQEEKICWMDSDVSANRFWKLRQRTQQRDEVENRDSLMESANVLISDRFDGMPNSSFDDTVSEARRVTGVKDKQESVTGGRQLTDVTVAEHGIHATMASDIETVDDNSVKNDLDECGCWKSLSNDARPDLRKWSTFPSSLGEIMRSLNSSKLDLTGQVPLTELCVLKARTSCNEQFAKPFINFVNYANGDYDSVVRDDEKLIECDKQVCGKCGGDFIENPTLCVNNLEAIRKFSEYFKTSLETDSKLREGIPDLNLDTDLGSELFNESVQNPPNEQNEPEDVTSFIFNESQENQNIDDMKNKKKTPANDNDSNMESTDAPRPGILKSALKRSKKFYRKKHRVQFDESLNKFFEADYVILVRDEQDFDDEYRCECGNQFCYEGCYYEDEDDEEEAEYENSVDSPRFDFGAAFDPPMEFVDPVTLSPPDGYKDGCGQEASQKVSISTMTNAENQEHRRKEGNETENWEKLQSNESIAAFNEKVKTQDCSDDGFTKRDPRNQRYPFHGNDVNASSQLALFNDANVQPSNGQSRYIVETITMTTVTERRIVRESNDQLKITDMSMVNDRSNGGILKGGKLWRNQETNTDVKRIEEKDDDKRSVKFIRDDNDETDNCDSRGENENKEFMLTFKLGNRVVPCNSLNPNSAVRQLFPDPRFVNPPTILDLEDDNLGKCEGKYLVTEESLRAFNEVNKRSVFAISGKERYPYKDGFTVHSDDEDMPQNDLIKKTIERNTLRRSLMRYPRGERKRERKRKIELSLEERIKQLTCVDDQEEQVTREDQEPIPLRTSPPGEESHETPRAEKSSAVSSTYKKFTDLFARNKSDSQNEHYPYYQPVYHSVQPDLGIDLKLQSGPLVSKQANATKSGTNEARKQFLSSLAPLTACVTGHVEPNYGNRDTLKLKLPGDRHSITSMASTGTEYSIGDIDEVLTKPEDGKAPQPDVVAGTPSGIDNQDELAMFVQQDASRIERIKKRYSNTPSTVSDDDEHDDYGFSRRPSVRGIKPRFGSTAEILQQMQAHLQQPAPTKAGSHMTWPYYSAECVEKNGATSPRSALPSLKEENDTKTAEYTAKVVWEKTGTIPRGAISTMQQPLKIDTNNVQMFRLTPSDTITEVAMPYKCEPDGKSDMRRFAPGNIFQMKVSPVSSTQVRLPMNPPDGQFTAHPIPVGTTSVIRVGHGQQQTFRVPCPVSGPVQVHLLATHHYENPQLRPSSQPIHFPPQIVVAKGTQTSTISTTSFYQLQTNTQSHYQNTGNIPVAKASEHTTKLIQVNYNASQHQSPPISSLTSSPTRVKNHMTERGIPEGAVSSSPAFIQDCVKPQIEPPSTTAQTQTKSGSLMHGMKV